MNIFHNLIDLDYKKGMGISGITDEFFCIYLSHLLRKENKNILVVVSSLYEANKLVSSLECYNSSAYLFPMDDFLTSEAIAVSPDLEINRLETLNITLNDEPKIIVTNLMGYLRFLPTKELFQNSMLNLKVGMEIEPYKLVEKLSYLGYKRETIVTKTGEIGIRGYVIDIFPVGEDYPIRIEFFGDEIDSIRYFNPTTQKSIRKLDELQIKPISEFLLEKEIQEDRKQKYLPKYTSVVNISKYLDNPIVVYKDYNQLEVSYSQIMDEVLTYKTTKDLDFDGNYMFDLDKLNESNYM